MKLIHKKMMISLVSVLSMLAIIGLVVLWMLWELGRFGNWGWESGYYGQYNRTKHVLEAMPHVEITNSWMHEDITLEDFGFYLVVNKTNGLRVDFWDGSPQKETRNKRLIQEYVGQKIDSNQSTARTLAEPGR